MDQKKKEDTKIDEEIKEYRHNLMAVNEDTKVISNNLATLEDSINTQRVIYEEYRQKVEHKKLESIQFAEKIKQQQKTLDKKIIKIEKNLKTLFEAQEELALLYNAHKSKIQNSGRFLDYVKNFETKASLKILREKLDIDRPAKPVSFSKKDSNQLNQVVGDGSNGEEVSFKIFKDILRGVLRENP